MKNTTYIQILQKIKNKKGKQSHLLITSMNTTTEGSYLSCVAPHQHHQNLTSSFSPEPLLLHRLITFAEEEQKVK